jgi:U3 small nucleolar RNA-associated protein MPP10
MAAEGALSSLSTSLQNIEENLERFISYDKKHSAAILSVLRDVFNRNKEDEKLCGRKIEGCPFESLQIDPKNIDNEIIWQQIQLQNESLLPKMRSGLKPLLKKANSVQLNDKKSTTIEKNEDKSNEIRNSDDSLEESNHSFSEGSENENSDEENNSEKLPKSSKNRLKPQGTSKPRGSVVDDQFFKLAEMEKFLESEHGRGDNTSGDESDENIDYFMDLEGGNGMSNIERYSVGRDVPHTHWVIHFEKPLAKNPQKTIFCMNLSHTFSEFRNVKDVMYSDYFDDPEGISGATRDDEGDSDENMEDVESDEGSSVNEKMAANELDFSEDDDSDDDPKSTLEKQQEKVSQDELRTAILHKLSQIHILCHSKVKFYT